MGAFKFKIDQSRGDYAAKDINFGMLHTERHALALTGEEKWSKNGEISEFKRT